jgi:hypothetical protein
MATPTVTPVVTLTWLQKHEKLVMVALVLGFSVFVAQKAYDYLAAKDALNADKTAAVLAQQVADNKQLMQQTQTATQQYTATLQTLQAQNAQLQQSIQQQNATLAAQQRAISSMSVQQVSQGIQVATNAPQGSVVTGNGTVTVQEDTAKQILAKLDEIPVLESKLASETQMESNTSTELVKAQAVIVDQTKQIDGLNTEIKDDKTTYTTEINNLKAQSRKSKLKWFGAGFITGFVSGIFVSHGG